MERKCTTCKWYYNQVCNNRDVSIINEDQEMLGSSYIEEGVLIETLREQINIEKLANPILKLLIDEKIIKKAYSDPEKIKNKVDLDEVKEEIIEIIDFALDKSIRNYFDVEPSGNDKLSIYNPEEFSCCHWE